MMPSIVCHLLLLSIIVTQTFCSKKLFGVNDFLISECGRETPSRNKRIVNGRRTELGTFPWHVGVYYLNWTSGELEHICGGSLISTELVVSAAHCFYNDNEHHLNDARSYAVAAGKFVRLYYEWEDIPQKSQVQSIYVPVGYEGHRNLQRKDIAILRLRKRFDMTNFVRPVCVDFSNAYTEEQLHSQQVGKIAGWGVDATGYPSDELQEINLPYIDRHTCQEEATNYFRRLITSDKICAGYLNGSSTCHGDSGGGLCFRSNGQWYLRGILTVGDVIGNNAGEVRCNNFYYSAFSNVANYTDWIESVLTDVGSMPPGIDHVQSCILPEPLTGRTFEHELCSGSCKYVPGFTFPIASILKYNCERGYSLQGTSNSICQNAGWSSSPTCIELKYCSSIPSSNNLDAVCQHDGLTVSCESDVVSGTKATLQCQDNYKMNFGCDNSSLVEITCSTNGTWNTNPALYHCTSAECGIAPETGEGPCFLNGTEIHAGDIPWPVFIFAETIMNRKEFICAGTLVKPDLVITSGSCHEDMRYRERRDNKGFSVLDSFTGSNSQEHPVKNYRAYESNSNNNSYYFNNMLALRLNTSFIPERYVSPLCMDQSSELDLPRAGEIGMVFVLRKQGTSTKQLTRYPTRVISNEECLSLLVTERRISQDQFCIELPADSTIFGNFAVRRNGVWYLAGVVNYFVLSEQSKWIIILTKIGSHMNWIQQIDNDL